MASVIPAEFQIKGQVSDNTKKNCKECDLKYSDHSGRLCGMCRGPVEHHTLDGFDDCLAGRRRMAAARDRAGLPLNDMDKLVLRDMP